MTSNALRCRSAQLAASTSLDWTCLGHVVRVEKEAAGDIRLNMRLFRACVNDQKKFCKGVEPGHMRVQVRGLFCTIYCSEVDTGGAWFPW